VVEPDLYVFVEESFEPLAIVWSDSHVPTLVLPGHKTRCSRSIAGVYGYWDWGSVVAFSVTRRSTSTLRSL
jgi:hypothetical protein